MRIDKIDKKPLAELFRGKPHLERMLKDKPYLKKGTREAMEIISN